MRKALGALFASALMLAAGGCLLLTNAHAADKGAPPPSSLPPAESSTWANWNRSAFYVGLGAGYGIAQMAADDFKFSNATVQGGLFGGYNWNMGNGFTLGVEADYWLTSIRGETSTSGFTINASTNYLATVRARAGMNAGPMLLYVTAGPAFTERKTSLTNGIDTSAWKDVQMGAAFGGGIDAELTKTLFLRLEAMHYIFPDKTVDGAAGFYRSTDQQTTVRVGVGFKLN